MTQDDAFAAWMALSFPWLHPAGADWRNLRTAWMAGHKAGQEERNG